MKGEKMKRILFVLLAITFMISACRIGPFPAKQQDVCMAIGLEPMCEEWADYCFEMYFVKDREDREWSKVLVPCDLEFPYGGPDLDYFYPPYVD
jgi:hypothetical protein